MAGNSEPLSPRAKLAVTAGKAAAAVSRAAGRGSGSVIGGKVALKLDPDLLGRLAQHLDVILVSATNGKTTTTRLIAEALRASGPGRLQRARRQHARRHHLGAGRRLGRPLRRDRGRREVPRRCRPGRDAQGHRAAQPLPRPARPRRRDPHARRELARGPGRFEGRGHRQRGRPAGRVGRLLLAERGVGRRRPGVEGRRLVLPVVRRRDAAPRRRLVLRRVRLPPPDARAGRSPATTCSTRTARPGRSTSSCPAAPTRRTPPPPPPSPPPSACRRRSRWSGCTRCRRSPDATTWCTFQGRELRLLLAKNPAGWLETFSLIDPPPTPVILSVNARGADGTDTSWLWDVDYTRLAGHPICVIGDRKLDLAVRLEVAGLDFQVCESLDEAVRHGAARPDRGRSPTTPRSRTCAAASATDRTDARTRTSEHERQQPAAGLGLPRPAEHVRRPGQRPGGGAPGAPARSGRRSASTSAPTSRSPPPATST